MHIFNRMISFHWSKLFQQTHVFVFVFCNISRNDNGKHQLILINEKQLTLKP